jgi:hypothetical protein
MLDITESGAFVWNKRIYSHKELLVDSFFMRDADYIGMYLHQPYAPTRYVDRGSSLSDKKPPLYVRCMRWIFVQLTPFIKRFWRT